jgi:hypothetical protein
MGSVALTHEFVTTYKILKTTKTCNTQSPNQEILLADLPLTNADGAWDTDTRTGSCLGIQVSGGTPRRL